MNHIPAENNSPVERLLYEFELAWFDNRASFEDFLPSSNSPGYLSTLTELVRSDMEFRSEDSQFSDAASYFKRFPELGENANARIAIVFEEYRLRVAGGDSVTAEQIGAQYEIESDGWPELRSAAFDSMDRPHDKSRLEKIKFPEVGDTFENFELVGQLGEGAFGRVFLAQQGDLESRLVVLKFTSAKTDEHRLLARLQHTNIVPIYSVHRAGDLQAICMPLLGVASLADLLRQCDKSKPKYLSQHSNALVETVNAQRELTVAETINDQGKAKKFRTRHRLTANAKRNESNPSLQKFATQFICQTAEGLGYAHQRGIVHGDLKPANLLVDDDGNAVILDFHLGYSGDEELGQHVGGTLPYMSPEHLKTLSNGEVELEPTSDIYSAGVVFYEMLTGSIPCKDSWSNSVVPSELANIKTQKFEIPAPQRKEMGEDLAAIVETCLECDPVRRYQTGNELALDLQRSQEFLPLVRAPNGGLSNRFGKWAKRNPRLASGSSMLAICSLVIAAAVLSAIMVNSKLNKLNAIADSRSFIESSRGLTPALATGHGLHDPRFFDEAISNARNFVEERSWTTKADLESQKHFGRLSLDDAAAETKAAAELHFWLADAYLKPVSLEGRENRILKAKKHNEIASSFWISTESSNALKHQAAMIEAARKGIPFEPAETISKDLPDNRLDRALSTYLKKAGAGAKQTEYLKLAGEGKDDFLAWLLLANACNADKKFEQAEAYYTVCMSIEPNSALPPFYRGLVRMEQGKLRSAISDFELAESVDPDEVSIQLNHALALGKSRKFNEALAKYDQAIELGASQTRVWYRRSQLKNALGDKTGSAADLAKFLETQPRDEISCITRGNLNLATHPQEAIKDYQSALLYNHRSTDAYNNLAHVYSEVLNNTKAGIEYMDKAILISPGNAKYLAARGVLHARVGHREAAIADAEKAMRTENSPDIWYRVAGIFSQTSKINPADSRKAVSLFAKAAYADPKLVLRMLPDDPDIAPIEKESETAAIVEALSRLKAASRKTNKKATKSWRK